MKKLLYFTLFCTTLLFAACENNEPNQPPVDSPSTPETPVNPDEPANPDTPNEPSDEEKPSVDVTFSKEFSVGIGKTVLFSPGNLQYNPASKEWRFAPNQTDMVGNGNLYASSADKWIDLFGWGTGTYPNKISTDCRTYTVYSEWGNNQIGGDAPGTWRTLTGEEWDYLLAKRPNAEKLQTMAQVNGVNGHILLPDAWAAPADVALKVGYTAVESTYEENYANFQTISASDWKILEDRGAVFLPAGGQRYDTNTIGNVGKVGEYWAGAGLSKEYYPYCVQLLPAKKGAYVVEWFCVYGLAVRLVKD